MSTIEHEPITVAQPDKGVLDPEHPRLNIGGGPIPIPGYLTVDKMFGDEAAFLMGHENDFYEEVYASHVLEHIGWRDYDKAIREWVRVLKPGGRLRISVPDIFRVMECYKDTNVQAEVSRGTFPPMGAVVMGGQTDANDFHQSLWNAADLKEMLKRMGLVAVREFKPFAPDCSQYPFCANVEGYKPTETLKQAPHENIAIAMSVPRLGFNVPAYRVMRAMLEFGADIYMKGGAYFDLSMEKAIQLALSTGRKYVLTIDYDTVFEPNDVRRLVMLLETHPDIDCLSAVQLRRGLHHILFSDENGVEHDLTTFSEEVLKVRSASFGLTIFRAEAFERMKYPWMRHVDEFDESGQWVNTVEADMMFWQNWRAAGNTVALATGVCVGHCEEFIVWPGHNYAPVYQSDGDYCLTGRPVGAHD